MIKESIFFWKDGERVRWTFKHNLDEYGLSIEDAFINWEARTTEFSTESFCRYVVSKDPVIFICDFILTKN